MKLPGPLILGICLLPMTVVAGDIYRWVDTNGQVHFGDKPPNNQAEPLHLPDSKPAAATASDTGHRDKQQRLLRAFEEERLKKDQEREQARQAQVKQERRCYQARDALRYYNQGGGIYHLDDKGNRVYMSEAERDAYVGKWREAVKQWCAEGGD